MFERRSRSCFLTIGLALVAVACTAPSPSNDRENWICARTADGRDWDCNQQRTRYGASATAATAATQANTATQATAGSDGRSPTEPAARSVSPVAGVGTAPAATGSAGTPGKSLGEKFNAVGDGAARDADKWNSALPALSSGASDAPLDSPLKPVTAEQRKPPPEPEPFFARWEKKADARALAEPSAAAPSAAVAKPAAAPVKRRPPPPVGSAPGTGAPAAERGSAYTVQLGAFKSDRAARAYIAQHKLEALPNLVVRPESQGEEHYVLITFGRFDTLRAAQDAWRASGAPSNLEVWIRPTAALPRPPAKAATAGDGQSTE